MSATIVELTNGTVEFVTCEPDKTGFTNHRVIITTGQRITATDDSGQHVLHFHDLNALRYHLSFGRCLANPFIAESYRAAFDYVSDIEPSLNNSIQVQICDPLPIDYGAESAKE